jgi:hypothetical protein
MCLLEILFPNNLVVKHTVLLKIKHNQVIVSYIDPKLQFNFIYPWVQKKTISTNDIDEVFDALSQYIIVIVITEFFFDF